VQRTAWRTPAAMSVSSCAATRLRVSRWSCRTATSVHRMQCVATHSSKLQPHPIRAGAHALELQWLHYSETAWRRACAAVVVGLRLRTRRCGQHCSHRVGRLACAAVPCDVTITTPSLLSGDRFTKAKRRANSGKLCTAHVGFSGAQVDGSRAQLEEREDLVVCMQPLTAERGKSRKAHDGSIMSCAHHVEGAHGPCGAAKHTE